MCMCKECTIDVQQQHADLHTWRISSRRSSGTLGKMTFCSTVSRMVPSPYLHEHVSVDQLLRRGLWLAEQAVADSNLRHHHS